MFPEQTDVRSGPAEQPRSLPHVGAGVQVIKHFRPGLFGPDASLLTLEPGPIAPESISTVWGSYPSWNFFLFFVGYLSYEEACSSMLLP